MPLPLALCLVFLTSTSDAFLANGTGGGRRRRRTDESGNVSPLVTQNRLKSEILVRGCELCKNKNMFSRRRKDENIKTWEDCKSCAAKGEAGTVTLDTSSRRRTGTGCLHPGLKLDSENEPYIAWMYAEQKSSDKRNFCDCLKKLIDKCTKESKNIEWVNEQMCACDGVCDDFKSGAGCPGSFVEARLMRRSHPHVHMQVTGNGSLFQQSLVASHDHKRMREDDTQFNSDKADVKSVDQLDDALVGKCQA